MSRLPLVVVKLLLALGVADDIKKKRQRYGSSYVTSGALYLSSRAKFSLGVSRWN